MQVIIAQMLVPGQSIVASHLTSQAFSTNKEWSGEF